MTECLHDATSIQGVVHQQPDGSWAATFVVPGGGRLHLRITHCPWCGVELWGKPYSPPLPSVPAVAHSSRYRGPRDG